MARNSVFPRAGIAVCVGSMLMISLAASANSRSTPEQTRLAEARALVSEYRELRRLCAAQAGKERKACFHELRASNNDYRLAKQQLGLMETEDPENIHLVTF